MKVKEMQLAGGDQPKQAPRGIDSNPLRTYLEHDLKVFTTDSAGRIVCNNGMFLGADIGGFDIILGRPWLRQASPSINWENDYWTHCQKNDLGFTPEIALVNAEEFEAECFKSNATAYMIAITDVDVTGNEVNAIPVIPSEYADLAHVFSEDAANTLPEHGPYDLQLKTISIPPFGPLYNLSQNELKVL